MLKQIPRYQNYYFTTTGQKKLYGVNEQGVSPSIEVIDQDGDLLTLVDFFTIKKDLYFTISEKIEDEEVEQYFKQDENEKVSKIATLPKKPTLRRVQFENGEFTIKDFDYKGKPCTDVDNITLECGFERFFEVNGYAYFSESGLYINVSDGRYNEKVVVRKNGLYFWPTNSKRCEFIKLPLGELW